jgi:hypothetical protein
VISFSAQIRASGVAALLLIVGRCPFRQMAVRM